MAKDSDRFYLGRIFDPKKGEVTADPLMYDPDDLTTHAVAVGMTGSGKTGLFSTFPTIGRIAGRLQRNRRVCSIGKTKPG